MAIVQKTDLVDFETVIPVGDLVQTKRKIKEVYDDIILFVLDESESSDYENLLTLGKVQTAKPVYSNSVEATITWSIFESI